MGGYLTTSPEKDVNEEKHALLKTLWKYSLSSYQKIYTSVTSSSASYGQFMDSKTFIEALPYPEETCQELADLFDYDEDGMLNWKSCLGGVLFCVQGNLPDKLHLFFKLHELLEGKIKETELRPCLLSLLLAVDRIQGLSSGCGSVKRGREDISELNDRLKDLLFKIYGEEYKELSARDIELWAETNLAVIYDLLDLIFCEHKINYIDVQRAASTAETGWQKNSYTQYVWHSLLSIGDNNKIPYERQSHTSCLYDGAIYIYGGKNGNIAHKDLWKFDIVCGKWERLSCVGDRPYSLQGHTMQAFKGELYMFGGEFSCSADLPMWSYNLNKKIWRSHHKNGDVLVPGGRRRHSAVIATGAMHIYGGYVDLKGSTSEMWSFDFEQECWHLAYASCYSSDGAGARHGHTAVVHDNGMWVYGGMTDLTYREDLWRWDFGMLLWAKIRCRNPLPPLHGHTACHIGGTMLVFGGISHGELHDELWCFNFALRAWQTIEPEGECPPSRGQHTAVVVTPLTLGAPSSQAQRVLSLPTLPKRRSASGRPPRPSSSPGYLDDNLKKNSFKNKVSPTMPRNEKSQSPISTVHETSFCKPAKIKIHPLDPPPKYDNLIHSPHSLPSSTLRTFPNTSPCTCSNMSSNVSQCPCPNTSPCASHNINHHTNSTARSRTSPNLSPRTSSHVSLCACPNTSPSTCPTTNPRTSPHMSSGTCPNMMPPTPIFEVGFNKDETSSNYSNLRSPTQDLTRIVHQSAACNDSSGDTTYCHSCNVHNDTQGIYCRQRRSLSPTSVEEYEGDLSSHTIDHTPDNSNSIASHVNRGSISYSQPPGAEAQPEHSDTSPLLSSAYESFPQLRISIPERRASLVEDDMVLEDIEFSPTSQLCTQVNDASHISSQLYTESPHDCDNHATDDNTQLLSHMNSERCADNNQCSSTMMESQTGCGSYWRSLVCSAHTETNGAQNAYSNIGQIDYPPSYEDLHHPHYCWNSPDPPDYEMCIQNDTNSNVTVDESGVIGDNKLDMKTSPICTDNFLQLGDLEKKYHSKFDEKSPKMNIKCSEVLQKQSPSQPARCDHSFMATSHKDLPTTYHVYIFGGKERATYSGSLGLHHLATWRLEVNTLHHR